MTIGIGTRLGPSANFTERFSTEARAIAALNHPNICTLYDVGPDYLVMEYVEGAEIKGPLPLDRALKIALQLASALEAAHRKGITHRDLKPANILTTKSGIKVLDFGLAKIELSNEGGILTATAVTVKSRVLEVGETRPLFRQPVGGYRYDVSARRAEDSGDRSAGTGEFAETSDGGPELDRCAEEII